MSTKTELFLLEKIRILVEVASSDHMIQRYTLAIAVLALGFVIFEAISLLRTERAEFRKVTATGAHTWRKRIIIGYLTICAAGEIFHRIVLVADAYYT